MKLVETDREGPGDAAEVEEVTTPPRPEHRRVSVSLLLTASVLIGTVVTVYVLFPERHNLLLTRSLALHREPPEFAIAPATQVELAAWSAGVFELEVPWPDIGRRGPDTGDRKTAFDAQGEAGLDGVQAGTGDILGAAPVSILNHRVAVVRYRIAGEEVTLVVQRARDALPRKHRRTEEGLHVVSWRKGRWTFVAVGDADRADVWKPRVGAP